MTEPLRNQPGGPFIEHFMAPQDRRTHTERLNPLEGHSFGWCPGAERGFHFQPKPEPVAVEVEAHESPPEPAEEDAPLYE